MCTVSIIPISRAGSLAHGFRLVCNRDERHHRADATAPRWRELGGGKPKAIWPTDGEAGGTWIAGNDRGLVLCLLNVNPTPAPLPITRDRAISRGKIIPSLAAFEDADAVIEGVRALELDRFAPFRLLALEGGDGSGSAAILTASWDGESLEVREHEDGPLCLASSGLGDSLVACRLELFEGMVVGAGCTPEAQDLFHTHRWSERPEISVMMSRADARTVSVTHVEGEPLRGGAWSIKMRYRPVVSDVSGSAIAAPMPGTRAAGGSGTR